MSCLPIIDLLGENPVSQRLFSFLPGWSSPHPHPFRVPTERPTARPSVQFSKRQILRMSFVAITASPVRPSPSTSAPLSAITNGARGSREGRRPLISQIRLFPLSPQSHTWGFNLSPSVPLPHVSFGLPPSTHKIVPSTH